MSCGHRCGLDPTLLWRRPATVAPIRPLAWEPPYAACAAVKRQKKKEKKNLKGNMCLHLHKATLEKQKKTKGGEVGILRIGIYSLLYILPYIFLTR